MAIRKIQLAAGDLKKLILIPAKNEKLKKIFPCKRNGRSVVIGMETDNVCLFKIFIYK